MFMYSVFIFTPYLITTTITNENCSGIIDSKNYGVVIFSTKDQSYYSVAHNYDQVEIAIYAIFIICAYISNLLRIIFSKITPRKTSHYKILLITWGISSTVKSLGNICVKPHLTSLIHLPAIIFCLNIFESLLFLRYHIRIDTIPFRIKFMYKAPERIIVQFNSRNEVEHIVLINEDQIL
ncbi:hypothetical protein RF11_04769 [Thelohanellus kitauei]|uniref:Uncharacterized protein n=1 Tax=Thelohanellus kitauei TaxID=669202 RepID=A0A0C2M622_THEKT|nr:hypothetical protein RF11_04769 [Thelohanellus kitauei]